MQISFPEVVESLARLITISGVDATTFGVPAGVIAYYPFRTSDGDHQFEAVEVLRFGEWYTTVRRLSNGKVVADLKTEQLRVLIAGRIDRQRGRGGLPRA